ncbi:DmsC/YnfH family molybdoenzyme membrane anchor subunit [Ramlibacter sp. AN1015]|uniref:dimethyl sulfoxide reductase anchor subunit family protein n=1 Tax=Ramlibacter sp. AN1015 TaxID=3133428 RepID=UPI0030BC20F4
MNPALSIVVFTTLAGAAQGLVVALAFSVLVGAAPSQGFLTRALLVSLVMLLVSLGASFLHLGRPARAWRAVLMWRTSWMSREVIVLPAFIAIVGLWALSLLFGATDAGLQVALALAAIAGAALLWYCTAMIYVCLRFVQEWAHPLTVINYTLIGLSSGLVLAGAVGVLAGEGAFVAATGPWALLATVVALCTRLLSLRRNARLKPRSTTQSATGLQGARVVQKSMGMSAGSFNTREFFHHASLLALRRIKLGFLLGAFLLPAALVAWGLALGGGAAWLIAVPLQLAGVLAERWFFFAQARHPQNLYYQVVS